MKILKKIVMPFLSIIVISMGILTGCGEKPSSGNNPPTNKDVYYQVTVVDGSGSGYYKEGATAKFVAAAPAEGKEFAYWLVGDIADDERVSADKEIVLVVSGNMKLTAVYVDAVPSIDDVNCVTLTVVDRELTGEGERFDGPFGSGEYIKGSTVTLTAHDNGWFDYWEINGEKVTTNVAYTFTINATTTAKPVYKNPADYATVNVIGADNVSGAGTYRKGETVTLSIEQSDDFVGWMVGNKVQSTDNEYSFEIAEDTTVKACYGLSNYATLTVTDAEGSGIYEKDAQVTLKVEDDDDFVGWMVGNKVQSTDNEYSFEIAEDTTVKACYGLNNYATLTVTGAEGSGIYEKGSTVTLSVEQNIMFIDWKVSGETVSTELTYSFTINENKSVEACYDNIENYATLTVSGAEGGGIYKKGETVTLSVEQSDEFAGWQVNGNIVERNKEYSFKLTEDTTVTAIYYNFDENILLNKMILGQSSSHKKLKVENLIDGNMDSYWATNANAANNGATDHYVIIDLQGTFEIKKFFISERGDLEPDQPTHPYYYRITSFEVEYSMDNENWTTAKAFTEAITEERNIILDDAITAKYIRLQYHCASNENTHLREFQAFGMSVGG